MEKEVKKILDFYKNNVISLYLYGSYAVGDQIEGISDYNFFLVLQKYNFSKELFLKFPPFIFTKDELISSTDTFPIELLDIKERGLLLFGNDILSEIEIKENDLRNQIERELKEKLVNFRRILNANDRHIPIFLFRIYKSLTPILRAILYLNKLDRPKKRIYIYYEISKFFDFDYHLFLKIEETIRNNSIENLNEFVFQFYEFLEKISKKYW